MRLDQNHHAFFALVQAGLWEQDVRLSQYGQIDFKEVYRLAEEQSVIGLVAAGIEHVTDVKVPQEVALTFVGSALQLEQRNLAMNDYIAMLIDQLRNQDIYVLLVKGQGIAQCYERPLWRACGDIDLLLSVDNYQKAKSFLSEQASSKEPENKQSMHLGLTIEEWGVELHGTLKSCCLPNMDKIIEEVQKDIFLNGNVRTWNNGNTLIFLPSSNNDVFLVFTHIIKHFFHGGLGLRQICDWCRLLLIFRDTIDIHLLESRLNNAGIMTEWLAFAAYAIEYLGMPIDAMPLYSPDKKWAKKSRRINKFILEVGNFGHNRDRSYYKTKAYIIRKTISFWRHTKDGLRHSFIFSLDSIRVWLYLCSTGVKSIIGRH